MVQGLAPLYLTYIWTEFPGRDQGFTNLWWPL